MFDVIELLKDWLAVDEHAMLDLPLKEADPDNDGGKFVSVKLHFDSEELGSGRPCGRRRIGWRAEIVVDSEVTGLKPKIEEFAEYHVQEIPRTAGWVKNANAGDVVEESREEFFGLSGLGTKRDAVRRSSTFFTALTYARSGASTATASGTSPREAAAGRRRRRIEALVSSHRPDGRMTTGSTMRRMSASEV